MYIKPQASLSKTSEPQRIGPEKSRLNAGGPAGSTPATNTPMNRRRALLDRLCVDVVSAKRKGNPNQVRS